MQRGGESERESKGEYLEGGKVLRKTQYQAPGKEIVND
jgi:hypothetical protein